MSIPGSINIALLTEANHRAESPVCARWKRAYPGGAKLSRKPPGLVSENQQTRLKRIQPLLRRVSGEVLEGAKKPSGRVSFALALSRDAIVLCSRVC